MVGDRSRPQAVTGLVARKPVRLAVFFDQTLQAGGGYQQAINAIALLRALPTELCDPFFVVAHPESVIVLRQHGVPASWLPLSRWRKALLRWRSRVNSRRLNAWATRLLGENAFDAFLRRHRIDLIYFTSPSDFAQLTESFNYIFTVWDLCHRDHVEFPEVRRVREFELRERYYRMLLPKAVATLVDSSLARDNVVRRYGIDAERVHVVPFEPAQNVQAAGRNPGAPDAVDVKQRYGLETDYVFYPAQFWAHKNHAYLLQGLKALESRHGYKLGAIFAGGDSGGNRRYIEQLGVELGVSARIRFAGFVPDEDLPRLYRQSVALVMPTYFGPTNLPPLEAFMLGVPVLYSDLPGLREQVGDAALLMNLTRPESMADHLHALLTQPGLRQTLVERGRLLMAEQGTSVRVAAFAGILEQFRHKRACWASI